MSKVILCYSGKSSVTGKQLYEKMEVDEDFERVIKVTKNKLVREGDVLIRWGNSISQAYSGDASIIELNKQESVSNASNKLLMMKKLIENEISIPQIFFTKSVNQTLIDEMFLLLKDESGNCFIRGSNNSVRYDSNPTSLDLYITKPILNKLNEYRVHVIGDKILGIYEKIPESSDVKLFKDHNCKFSKCNPEVGRLRCNEEAQQLCIDAIKALGLDFGGVDIMRDGDGRFFISEVNSSPSLNSINIEKYIQEFKQLITEKSNVS